MAISATKSLLKDIYSVVGREIIQFHPSDRVKLDISARMKDNSLMNYFVGGVYYDPDYGEMAFDMYNSKGEYISPARNAHLLSSLSSKVLSPLKETVQKYHDLSILRSKSIQEIDRMLCSLPEQTLSFDGVRNPAISIFTDGYRQMINVAVDSMFKDNGKIYIQGHQDDRLYTRNLSEITDLGISNISQMLKKEGKYKISVEKEIPVKDSHKAMSL